MQGHVQKTTTSYLCAEVPNIPKLICRTKRKIEPAAGRTPRVLLQRGLSAGQPWPSQLQRSQCSPGCGSSFRRAFWDAYLLHPVGALENWWDTMLALIEFMS